MIPKSNLRTVVRVFNPLVSNFAGHTSLAIIAGILCAAPLAVLAQQIPSAAPTQTSVADGKPLAFDVVSIREDKTEPSPQNPPKYGPTPDGYRLKGPPLTLVIRAAYLPSPGSDTATFGPRQLAGVPPWLNQVHYDIDAKVSEADLPKWRDPAQQPAMLRAMLQAMLVDRFKLVVHRDSKEAPIYEMTVAGNGPKFKPSKAATLAEVQQTHPNAGNAVALGGAIVSPGAQPGEQMIFGVTMPAFSTLLSTLVGRPIRDKTGLTGRYDIIYQMDLSSQDSAGPATSPNDLSAQILSILRDQLGLQLKPAKGSVETLVIDHIEQPSEN
jgi:bla regulator protein BlaR1